MLCRFLHYSPQTAEWMKQSIVWFAESVTSVCQTPFSIGLMRSSSVGLAAAQLQNYARRNYNIKLWMTTNKKKEFNNNL
jgi:hypothetical protein